MGQGSEKEFIEYSLQTLRQLGSDFLEGKTLEGSIDKFAFRIASTITPGNEQFVVIRILERDIYKITYGEPAESERHGVGSIGHLLKPVEKKALTRAIKNREVVIVNDAKADPLTAYMYQHVVNKDIKSVAVIPVGNRTVKYLIVIDKAGPQEGGFNVLEASFLKECQKSINRYIDCLDTNGFNNGCDFYGILNGLQDILRNYLQIAGGRINRILKNSTDFNEIQRNAEMALTSIESLEMEIAKLMQYMSYLRTNGDLAKVESRTVDDYMQEFYRNAMFTVQIADDVRWTETELPADCVSFLLAEVRDYVIRNGKQGCKVEVKSQGCELVLSFRSSGFQPFKQDKDAILCMIQALIRTLAGTFSLAEYQCRITLPLRSPGRFLSRGVTKIP